MMPTIPELKPPIQLGQAVTVVRTGQELRHVAARLDAAHDYAIDLITDHPLRSGEHLKIQIAPGHVVEGDVTRCGHCPGGYSVSIELTNLTDRRNEHRISVFTKAQIAIQHPRGESQDGVIVDVSKNGLGLVCPQPIARGTLVQISFARTIVFGEARHCSAQDRDHYRIGIAIDTAVFDRQVSDSLAVVERPSNSAHQAAEKKAHE